jgi:hypothetical protein
MHQAIALPGAVLPAELAYAALREALADDDVDIVSKDLEVYATSAPPPGYSLDTEIEGVARAADSAGFRALSSRRLLSRRSLRDGVRGPPAWRP